MNNSRMSRNANLYREVYGDYGNFDHIPIGDNTNEIDMNSLKDLLNDNKSKQDDINYDDYDLFERPKKNIDERKMYDINEMLNKAKLENTKVSMPVVSEKSVVNKNILSTLTNNSLLLSDIKREKEKKFEVCEEEDNFDLEVTREIKYSSLQKKVENMDAKISQELFSDLKDDNFNKNEINDVESNIHSSDTTDIDIIKKEQNDESFFTSSYAFSKNDFSSDDDFFDDKSSNGIFKIILLMLSIFILVGVIVYFFVNYGIVV